MGASQGETLRQTRPLGKDHLNSSSIHLEMVVTITKEIYR